MVTYLLGAIGTLVAYLIYTKIKQRSAEALLENLEVGKKANDIDKNISKNEGLLESEEAKRKEIEEKVKKEKENNGSLKDYLDRSDK
jgi:hypothetical protein